MAQLDDVGRNAQPGDEYRSATFDYLFDLADQVAGHRRQQVYAEWLVCSFADSGHFGHHSFVAHRGGTEASEPSGLRYGGDKRCIGNSTHAGQHHRMFDAEDVGEPGLHHELLCQLAAEGHPSGRPPAG